MSKTMFYMFTENIITNSNPLDKYPKILNKTKVISFVRSLYI